MKHKRLFAYMIGVMLLALLFLTDVLANLVVPK